jgi:hypothetical protein
MIRDPTNCVDARRLAVKTKQNRDQSHVIKPRSAKAAVNNVGPIDGAFFQESPNGNDLRKSRATRLVVYSKLVYYKKHDKGGHFAAWEQPELYSEDVRAGFRSLRSSVAKSEAGFAMAS